MNKKGNIYLGVSVALVVWIAGILILPFILDDIDTFRTEMDCTNSSISSTSKINCLAGDTLTPYFIWTLSSLAIGFFAGSRVS